MEELTISVKGSSPDPYKITFILDGESLTALCTCPAGTFGNLCKHRVAILDGDGAAVIDEDVDKVRTIVEWLVGTDVEKALQELRAVESAEGATKDDIAVAKRGLGKVMNS